MYSRYLFLWRLIASHSTLKQTCAFTLNFVVQTFFRFGSIVCLWMGHCNSPISLSSNSNYTSMSCAATSFNWNQNNGSLKFVTVCYCLFKDFYLFQVILLLGHGPDAPPKKLHLLKSLPVSRFSWRPVMTFILWAFIWSAYVLALSSISLRKFGGLSEMFKK